MKEGEKDKKEKMRKTKKKKTSGSERRIKNIKTRKKARILLFKRSLWMILRHPEIYMVSCWLFFKYSVFQACNFCIKARFLQAYFSLVTFRIFFKLSP